VTRKRPDGARQRASRDGRAELLLVRTESAAVTVGSLLCYPGGFEFSVHVRVRELPGDELFPLSDPFGPGRPGRRIAG